MSRDAKLKLRFPLAQSSTSDLVAAVIGALAAPPFLAQAQDVPSQQAAPSAKSSSGSHAHSATSLRTAEDFLVSPTSRASPLRRRAEAR